MRDKHIYRGKPRSVELFVDLLSRIQDNLTIVSTDVTVMSNCKQAETKI